MDVDRYSHLHPQIMTLSEFGRLVSNLMNFSELSIGKMLKLRREKPGCFCLLICSILLCTAYIGSTISGLNLILLIVTGLVSAPGIYLYLLPAPVVQYLRQTFIVEIYHKAIQESQESQHHQDGASNINSSRPITAPAPPTKTTHSSSLLDNLLNAAYQSNKTPSQEKGREFDDKNVEDEEDEDDEYDDQHDFVIL